MFAKSLKEAITDVLIAMDICESGEDLAEEINDFSKEQIDWYLNHPNWPSTATRDGFPLELSIAITNKGKPVIRCAIDPADHRDGIAGNWNRYLNYSKFFLGIDKNKTHKIRDLFVKHLNGVWSEWGTNVGYGVGYGSLGFKRGVVYFFHNELFNRFPEYVVAINKKIKEDGSVLPEKVHVTAYEYYNGTISKIKFYWWLKVNSQTKHLSDIAGQSPNLSIAGKIYEHFLESRILPELDTSISLQLGFNEKLENPTKKAQFSCHDWNWDRPETFHNLITYLQNNFSVDLSSLYIFLRVFSEYKIQLKPTWFSVSDGEPYPNLCFYFSPVVEELPISVKRKEQINMPNSIYSSDKTADSLLEFVDQMYKRAVDYVLRMKNSDGYWEDFALPQGASDEWVTAYIASILSIDPNLHGHLSDSAEWLKNRFQSNKGWGYNNEVDTDADATALGILSLHRIGHILSNDSRDVLLRFRLPRGGYKAYTNLDIDDECGAGVTEISAIALLTQIETGAEPNVICDTVENLISQQRDEGGWNASWWKDDLFATHRVLQALNAFIRFADINERKEQISIDVIDSAKQAIEKARSSISAQVTPSEPFVLGLWLSSWFEARGSVSYPSVKRILYHLWSQQQEDGRWLSLPIKRIARTKLLRPWARSDAGKLYLDPQCLVTTTAVIEGLFKLREELISKTVLKDSDD